MKWTNSIPTTPGWYWKRDMTYGEDEKTIVYVRDYAGDICVYNWKILESSTVFWAGPIAEPLE